MLAYPDIDPVALELGPLQIHWYGLAYVAGLSFAWWFGLQRTRQADAPVKAEQVEDLIFYAAIGVILGGRLGYVFFYGFGSFLADPMWLFRVWEGGMAFHGGLLGVITAMAVFSHQRKIRFGRLMDLVSVMTPLGLALGRLGNFIGQELWGRPTDLPWGMIFPRDPLGLARHPSQLYQFFLEGCLLLAIVYLFSRKQRPEWATSGLFLLCYGFFRFYVEFFREPDMHIGFVLYGWMTRGQLLCIPMILLGGFLFFWSYRIKDR